MCLADFPLKLLVCPTAPSPKKRERHVKPREPRTPRGQSNFIRRWWLESLTLLQVVCVRCGLTRRPSFEKAIRAELKFELPYPYS